MRVGALFQFGPGLRRRRGMAQLWLHPPDTSVASEIFLGAATPEVISPGQQNPAPSAGKEEPRLQAGRMGVTNALRRVREEHRPCVPRVFSAHPLPRSGMAPWGHAGLYPELWLKLQLGVHQGACSVASLHRRHAWPPSVQAHPWPGCCGSPHLAALPGPEEHHSGRPIGTLRLPSPGLQNWMAGCSSELSMTRRLFHYQETSCTWAWVRHLGLIHRFASSGAEEVPWRGRQIYAGAFFVLWHHSFQGAGLAWVLRTGALSARNWPHEHPLRRHRHGPAALSACIRREAPIPSRCAMPATG